MNSYKPAIIKHTNDNIYDNIQRNILNNINKKTIKKEITYQALLLTYRAVLAQGFLEGRSKDGEVVVLVLDCHHELDDVLEALQGTQLGHESHLLQGRRIL